MAKNSKKNSNSFISGIIGILIIACILSRFSTFFIILGGGILFFLILYIIVKRSNSYNKKSSQNRQTETYNTFAHKDQVKRYVEIMTESISLVNDSNNLDTVLHRYGMAIDMLKKLSEYTISELSAMGLNVKNLPSETLKQMQDKKVQLFNQAITRNLEHDIDSVVKSETKVKKILNFRDKYADNPLLLPANKDFLNEQCNTYITKYMPQNYTQINTIDHTVKTITKSADGALSCNIRPDNFIKEFYELSSLIDSSKDINEKLDACEKSYPLLAEFCRYCIQNDGGELPPFINCRDVGPEMYMRLGRWDDVERVLQICAQANAYYPNDDSKAWEYYSDYKRIANLAVSYIQNNPGLLQSKIYNALNIADDDRNLLKHFLRCSKQIKKVKHGNTNELYIADTN